MPDYKLYFIAKSGHISRRIDLDCRDDAHAIEVVGARVKDADHAMELWESARLVKRFEPTND